MEETKRSPKLPSLYAKRTDCVIEWVCHILNEEDSAELKNFKNYLNDYLAFSEEHSYMIDDYFRYSLRKIRVLKNRPSKIEEINALFDKNIVEISQHIEKKKHKEVEKSLHNFFESCDKIAA